MSFTSYALVIHDEDVYSHKAGISYLSMSVAGGLVLLMGIFILYDFSGTLLISEMADHIHDMGRFKYVISALIIAGFGVKASLFPFHVWVPKAYSAAPTPASAVLAGVLKKTGVFGIMIMTMVIFKGDLIVSSVLVVLGFLNILVGGFFAIFQRNVKRILAYSSMSQAGYIFVGIGLAGLLKEHGAVAVMGTLFHIVNHGLFKVLLFLGAGLIYMLLNDLSINKIRGFGRYKSKLKYIFLIAICGIVGMPGFNGYISKTLLHEALAEAHHMYHTDWFIVAEILFTLGSAFTAAYMCKLFVAVFVEKNEAFYGQYKDLIRKRAMVPMFVLSGAIMLIGMKPEMFINVFEVALSNLGYESHVSIEFFTMKPMGMALGTIILGIGIYMVFVRTMLYRVVEGKRIYVNPSLSWFQLEEHLYRPVVLAVFKVSSMVFKKIDRVVINFVEGTNNFVNGVAAWDGGRFKDLKLLDNIRIVKSRNIGIYNKTVAKVHEIDSDHMKDSLYSILDQAKAKVSETARIEKKHSSEDDEVQREEEYITLKSLIKKAHTDASGITYSIYLLAVVLVATIGVMFFVNGV